MISERKLQANQANLAAALAKRQAGNRMGRCETCGIEILIHVSRKRRFCSRICRYARMRGSQGPNSGGGQWMTGDHNPNWKGGDDSQDRNRHLIAAHRKWRTLIFERDGYICQRCGHEKGKTLRAHHIAPWAEFPDKRFELTNGVTLCDPCHRWVHSKANTKKEWLCDAATS